ncbi:MAG: hypothetical protein ABW088_15285 [Sedimenticola sp.]
MAKSKYKGYVRLENDLLESPAWRSLKPVDRALFVELKHRCRPAFNGYLGFGVRDAAEALGCKPQTVSGSFGRLQNRGFIVMMRESNWQMRQAREWRLTTDKWNGNQPTNDWKKWVSDDD